MSWAVSGWLVGADAATAGLDTALSLYQVRGLVRRYLTESNASEREAICKAILQEYAGDPATVAAIVAHMKPPLSPPEAVEGKPGYYLLKTPGLADSPAVTYYVQLPPEYDPYRRYPTIVTLHGELSNAEKQIDWWAGPWKDGQRAGQAARHGYIVIAPAWTVEHQTQYHYSAREHAAVLNSLRDACRRFSIDTDRVYLSGHSIGGDAAWDIGLAHPDLWAGVIPIAATSDRYCTFYWENARYVPFYVVVGELDGDRLTKNALDLDRYLRNADSTPRLSSFSAADMTTSTTRFCGSSTGWAASIETSFPASSSANRCVPGTMRSGGSRCKGCRQNRWSIRPTGRRRPAHGPSK